MSDSFEAKPRFAALIPFFVFVVFICWGLLRAPDVSDQRNAAADTRGALERAGIEQRNAKEHIERVGRELDDSIRQADRITKRIDEAQDAIRASQNRRGECESLISDSERRIAESRGIIQSVRSRPQ